MQFIPIYLPTLDGTCRPSNLTAETVAKELAFLEKLIKERNKRIHQRSKVGYPLLTDTEWSSLSKTLELYLTSEFQQPVVPQSSWRGGVHHDLLYRAWESRAVSALHWRGLLRDWHEEARCPFCLFFRDSAIVDEDDVDFDDELDCLTPRLPIDHYLPRSKWPELSCVATNLVPICDTCNSRRKKAEAPEAGELRKFLHPYFDSFIDQLAIGVTVSVNSRSAPRLRFHMNASNVESSSEAAIAESHFRLLRLHSRYVKRFAAVNLREITARHLVWQRQKPHRSTTETKAWLEQYYSATAEMRGAVHWETAAMGALAESQEFVDWLQRPRRERRTASNR